MLGLELSRAFLSCRCNESLAKGVGGSVHYLWMMLFTMSVQPPTPQSMKGHKRILYFLPVERHIDRADLITRRRGRSEGKDKNRLSERSRRNHAVQHAQFCQLFLRTFGASLRATNTMDGSIYRKEGTEITQKQGTLQSIQRASNREFQVMTH